MNESLDLSGKSPWITGLESQRIHFGPKTLGERGMIRSDQAAARRQSLEDCIRKALLVIGSRWYAHRVAVPHLREYPFRGNDTRQTDGRLDAVPSCKSGPFVDVPSPRQRQFDIGVSCVHDRDSLD